MVAELLETIVIAEEHFDGAVGFGKEILNGLAALGAVVLPEV